MSKKTKKTKITKLSQLHAFDVHKMLEKSTDKRQDIRILVDLYYDLQEVRKAAANRIRATVQHSTFDSKITEWFQKELVKMESDLEKLMDAWTNEHPVGVWSKSIQSVGPVLSAAFIAYIDIKKAPTAGHIWRFAGMDPSVTWYGKETAPKIIKEILGDKEEITEEDVFLMANTLKRKPETLLFHATDDEGNITRKTLTSALKRRPWNARLKTTVWKLANVMKKSSKRKVSSKGKVTEASFYGVLYQKYKAEEVVKNLHGNNTEAAKKILESKKKISKEAKALHLKGRLTDGHVDSRAMRRVGKMFISHWHDIAYREEFGKAPPKPFAIEFLGHAHYIEPPQQAEAS